MPKVKAETKPVRTAVLDEMAGGIRSEVLKWVRAVQTAAGLELDSADESALVAVGVRTCPADRETLLRLLGK